MAQQSDYSLADEVKMLSIRSLNLGFNDAENYRRKESKELFNRVFIKTEWLDMLCKPEISFLIGEKGTGKTAHAVYLTNSPYRDTYSVINFIRETEYQKFVSLKKEKQLSLSDYTNIWKVILYLLLSKKIREDEGNSSLIPNFITES